MYGLYIHFPFCQKKCFYCDFYSLTDLSFINQFVDCLVKEINITESQNSIKPKVDTIFFGGGTPSLLEEHHLEKIFNAIHSKFDIQDDNECTLESNPGTLTREKLTYFRRLGVNRISMGVQSMNDDELKFLTRIHDSREVVESVENARSCGFDNLSLDLIFSLPGQKPERWINSLEKVIKLNPEHISTYSLIFEPHTELYNKYIRKEIRKNDIDDEAKMYAETQDILISNGYGQYEVSNFTKPGRQCRHNLKYWHCGQYFAFGPSAHGYIGEERYWNFRNLKKYISMTNDGILPRENSEHLTQENKMEEGIFLPLRADGIDITDFNHDFEIDLSNLLYEDLADLQKNNLIIIEKNKIQLTRTGYALGDEITVNLISALEKKSKLITSKKKN